MRLSILSVYDRNFQNNVVNRYRVYYRRIYICILMKRLRKWNRDYEYVYTLTLVSHV